MAPAAGSLKILRDGDDNRGSSDDSNDSFGKGSSGSGSSSPKDPNASSPPFKVITREVTVTRISTAPAQTSTIFLSTSSSSSSTGIPTTSPLSTSSSAATSSFLTSTPPSSTTDLNPPLNSSANDGSPSSRLMPVGTKTPLPVASIISIILGCLFFITLCLVICVRSPRCSNRLADLVRRRHTPAAPTISSFEPKEVRSISRNTYFGPSARSFVALPDFYSVSTLTEISGTTSSPRRKGLLAVNASSHNSSSSNSRDSYPQGGYRVASSEIQFLEDPSRTISVFDEYPFEHDVTDIRPHSINAGPVENRSSGFPQSVQDMTVE